MNRRILTSVALLAFLTFLTLSGCSSSGGGGVAATQITSTSPGVIQASDSFVTWTLTGTGFKAGLDIQLIYTGIDISNVVVVSSVSVTFQMSVATGVVAGTVDLVLTNSDATSATTTLTVLPAAITLSGFVQPILTAKCLTACHSGPSPTAGLNLSASTMFAATVGVASTEVPSLKIVMAGDASASYMIDKLEGTQTVGDRMPATGAFLNPVQLATIRNWITAGAMNN